MRCSSWTRNHQKSTQFPQPLGMVILRNVTLIELHPIKCCRNNNDDEAKPLETTTRDCSQVSWVFGWLRHYLYIWFWLISWRTKAARGREEVTSQNYSFHFLLECQGALKPTKIPSFWSKELGQSATIWWRMDCYLDNQMMRPRPCNEDPKSSKCFPRQPYHREECDMSCMMRIKTL